MSKARKIQKAVTLFILTVLCLQSSLFFSFEKVVSDLLFQRGRTPDKGIYIIAIDDKSLQKYGAYESWPRSLYAELLHTLNGEDRAPAVIGMDILFLEHKDDSADEALVQACEQYDNVVGAVNIQFKPTPEKNEKGKYILNPYAVDEVDQSFPELQQVLPVGYANSIVDADGCVRRSMYQLDTGEGNYLSLSAAIYEKYMERIGGQVRKPRTDKNNIYQFSYAGKSGGYSVVSFCDVLDGTIPPTLFQDKIVLVGAYAAGLFDSYMPAISHGSAMYGVEIQANIVDALIHHKTVYDLSGLIFALLAATLLVLFGFWIESASPKQALAKLLAAVTGYLLVAVFLHKIGFIIPVLVVLAWCLILFTLRIAAAYLEEYRKRREIHKAFKQYVAPQIVDKISKQGTFEVKLGGEKRNIAIMFVDIRGFTTMSEKLQPEEVVEILNSYLALATDAIFSQEGTLDKFVGDAAMAVFNAPFDLDDYVYKAVLAAITMREGAQKLSDEIMQRFGNQISFGIGVNVGDAVVGNIGCDFRMDYTAIGDAVNTAARLESNAKGNQILISQPVYEQIKDRVETEPVGEIPLKGKAKGVFVHKVIGVRALE